MFFTFLSGAEDAIFPYLYASVPFGIPVYFILYICYIQVFGNPSVSHTIL